MQKNIYIIPLSIIIAGGLIGGGLAYGLGALGGSSLSRPAVQGEEGSEKSISEIAQALGLDMKKFDECLKGQKYAKRIEANAADAANAGAQGTPYSIIIDKSGNKISLVGAQPYEQVKLAIDEAIKGFLKASPLINIAPVLSQDHIRGDVNAAITIVEYSDFSCPFCKRFHPTLVQAVKEYDGKVRWVYRHLPLSNIHPNALNQANASECATEQGKFWEFTDAIFE